jgi:hypothetical protein
MASHQRPSRTANHRSGLRARDRAVVSVRRATTFIGLAAAASAAGLGVLVASETTVHSPASAADRVTSGAASTASGQTTTTTSPTSAASTSGSASAGTTATNDDPSTTTTTEAPATHTVSGQT